jgi:hypothetical protein
MFDWHAGPGHTPRFFYGRRAAVQLEHVARSRQYSSHGRCVRSAAGRQISKLGFAVDPQVK